MSGEPHGYSAGHAVKAGFKSIQLIQMRFKRFK
jgi:hypothetical protein